MNRLEELNLRLHSLVIFRGLLTDPALKLLPALLARDDKSMTERINAYSAFAARLFEENEDLTGYLWRRIAADENIYVLKRARKQDVDSILKECLEQELGILEDLSRMTGQEVRETICYDGYLPAWTNSPADFLGDYKKRMENITSAGYGKFSEYHVFSALDKEIIPVKFPDPILLSDLKGYEKERKVVMDNTAALLQEKPAANVLLYGDAGTGKSSTVKAIVNELKDQGLRLIEIKKNQLADIPAITEALSQNPLKFILFIDDLSFPQNTAEVGILKATLEGSVYAKTPNVVIYATSNRRHLVNETFSERGNDDIHINETIQEQVSLSERFGLSVNFSRPDKELYLMIVRKLSEQYGIAADPAELSLRAERYALARGGRSPRVARQFVEYLRSE